MLCRFYNDPKEPTIITLEQKDEYTLETFEILKGLMDTFRTIFPGASFLS